MQITVDIPESAVQEAAARGVAVEAVVHERLSAAPDFVSLPGFTQFGNATKSASEAAADIRDLRLGQTLGGEITIAQLMDEGRRF